jgi:hypothetical protein
MLSTLPKITLLAKGRAQIKTQVEPVMVVYIYNPSYLGGEGKRITNLMPVWAQLERLRMKNIETTDVYVNIM